MNLVGHIRGKGDGLAVKTLGIYPVSCVKRILHNGQQTRNGLHKVYEGVIATLPFGSLGL